jgi:dipeptidase E
MKLLLTSNGLSNASIANALEELVGKPRTDIKIAFIPTAAFPEDEDKHQSRDWLVNDLYRIKEFCGFIDVVSLADLSHEQVLARLEYADVIFVGGGNTFYLSYCMEQAGLFEKLPELLKTRVYAGISAGSMIATPTIRTASQAINSPDVFYDEEYEEFGPEGRSLGKSFGLVDFAVRPHYKSKMFPKVKGDFLEAIAKDIKIPLYALDDMSAVKVIDDEIEVVSEGDWKLIESKAN